MAEFAKMLELLGLDPDERLSINTTVSGEFRSIVTTVAEAPNVAATFAEADCWYGPGALHERVEKGRGHARDVVGVREVWADLDVKPGGMPDYAAARAVIDDLAGMLGEYPAAVVATGHGLHPHWTIERGEATDWPDETDARWKAAVVLWRRWHRLVLHVAEVRGGTVDNVSDLSRVLRTPGTTNRKGDPVPVTVEFAGGAPVTLERLAETLDEYGIPAMPGDDEVLGEVVSEPGSWEWGGRTCGYVARMVEAWSSDTPAARHPWLVSQAVRLAAAHRAGCVTEADYHHARRTLTARFRWLIEHAKPERDEARGELAEAFAWGVARVSTYPHSRYCLDAELGGHTHLDVPTATTIEPLGDAGQVYEWFWTQRDVLAHVLAFARARRVSPWAMLGVTLVRVAAVVPPFVVLPALVGSHVSLNVYIGFVGRSGAGKDSAINAAADAVDVGHVTIVGVGSGEGIAHQYVTYKKPNDKTGEPGGLEQHTTSVVFDAPEVETLAALKGRQSSTLLPELRKAWTGTALGFAYVDREKRLKLPAHAYRLGLIVGIQPEKAGPLLDDGDAGTPQRLLWLPAADPDAPDVAPDEPEPIVWRPPAPWPIATAGGRVVLNVCQDARRAVDTARLARLRGEGDALDGHALLARLKVAALLGILDGRTDVNGQDWVLAGVILAKSEHTRGQVAQTLKDARREANRAKGEAEGERAVVVAEKTEDAAIRRVCRFISRKLADGQWCARGDLRRGLASRDRSYFDPAVDRLIDAGHIVADDTGRGARYRLADGAES